MPSDLKESFEQALELVRRAHASGEGGHAVAALHASEVDAILAALFEGAVREMGAEPKGVALVALGGYGRRELAPYSDLDVLLVYRGWGADDIGVLNRRLFYPLWDAGREVGNRVREVNEVVRHLGRADEAAAVLDAHPVAGDHRLYVDLEGAALGKLHGSRAGFFRSLVEENRKRRVSFGHAGHLLEPHLRDSAGGLRDIQTVRWAAKLLPGAGTLDELVESGYLSPLDHSLLEEASDFLLRVRVDLHLAAGRRHDRLFLADQDAAAVRLGYRDTRELAAGDALMRDLYRHARDVDAIVEGLWERLTHRQGRRLRRSHVRTVGDGCVIREGRLEVVAAVPPIEDPAGWLQVFVHSVRERAQVGRPSLNWLHSACSGLDAVDWTPAARGAFVEILRSGAEGTRALETMDAAGFLGALLPEWRPLRGCPQRNLYHRFSVDMHCFASVAELVASRTTDEPDVDDAWSRVQDDEALLMAVLLHDVGKGRGGDHVAVGAELAVEAARRTGLGPRDVDDVAFLVREHLTLADLATRRDLNDERTAAEAAARAGDARRLAMLFLLTRADSIATGPEAWSPFRASLIRELYAKALRLLEGRDRVPEGEHERRIAEIARELDVDVGGAAELVALMPPSWLWAFPSADAAEHLKLMEEASRDSPAMRVRHRTGADELVLVAPDRPGLFATASGVLASRGVNVLEAEIYTRADGAALEVFRVNGVPPERWESIRQDMARAVSGGLDVAAGVRAKAREARRRGPDREPRVIVDNQASDFYTVVEVHTADMPGLLYAITSALAEAGCDLHLAKVATYGADVVDVFYVRDVDGQKVEDVDRVRAIRESVEAAVRRGA